MTPRNLSNDRLLLSPSVLSYKILCSAFIPQPFDPTSRLRVVGLHAIATVSVIRRHLKNGYRLAGIECGGRGFRQDLLFEAPSGKTRLSEVKSAQIIRPLHKIQAALYWQPNNGIDEIVVSNREIDIPLSSHYILEIAEKAQTVLETLRGTPETARTTYTPNLECRYCANSSCPWLPLSKAVRPSFSNPFSER